MIKIGIDPGFRSGSIAVKAAGMTDHWTIREFLQTPYFEIDKLLSSIKDASTRNKESIYCVIEKQMVMPKQGAVSSGKLMMHYGILIGLLLSNKIPYVEVVPRTWMKLYGMTRNSAETKTQWKNRLKQRAKEVEPDLDIKSSTADAILIARIADKLL